MRLSIALLIMAGTVALDQVTKALSVQRVETNAFGLFIDLSLWHVLVAGVGLLVIAVLVLILYERVAASPIPYPVVVPLAVFLGGDLSQLGEVAVQRCVTDFLRVGPTLTNVADIAMAFGVVATSLACLYVLFQSKERLQDEVVFEGGNAAQSANEP